jgi:hypothetical protein
MGKREYYIMSRDKAIQIGGDHNTGCDLGEIK